jgi:hypothetical protein
MIEDDGSELTSSLEKEAARFKCLNFRKDSPITVAGTGWQAVNNSLISIFFEIRELGG